MVLSTDLFVNPAPDAFKHCRPSPSLPSESAFDVDSGSAIVCAKLVTIRDNRKEGRTLYKQHSSLGTNNLVPLAILLSLAKPVTIGRDPLRW